jgi:hypothetical protein
MGWGNALGMSGIQKRSSRGSLQHVLGKQQADKPSKQVCKSPQAGSDVSNGQHKWCTEVVPPPEEESYVAYRDGMCSGQGGLDNNTGNVSSQAPYPCQANISVRYLCMQVLPCRARSDAADSALAAPPGRGYCVCRYGTTPGKLLRSQASCSKKEGWQIIGLHWRPTTCTALVFILTPIHDNVPTLAGALRSLAVAASHPDVIVGTGAGGLSGGEGERDEVREVPYCTGPL